jgi:DNA-directed RNA polymerase I subunit RPA1
MSELFDLDHALAGASSRAKNRAAAEQQQQQSYLHPTALAKIGVTGMGEVLSRYQAEFSQQQQQQRRGRQQQPPPTLTSYQREVRKQLVAELVGFCKAKSCPHCGAASPSKVRGDASNKVFVKYTAAARRLNRLERQHETMESALAIAENENSNHKRGATRDSRRSGGSAVSDGNDSEDTEPENLDDDDSADGSNEDQTLSGDGDNKTRDTPEDEDDDDDELDEPSSGATKDGEKYMHPGEVQAQLRRTWELHPFLCNCLFGSDDVFADNSHGCGDSGSDGSPARSGLDKYFLRAVPVPPSRFRPPMQLGSLSVEHAQTQYLGKILQLNNALRTHLKEAKEGSGSSSSYSSSSKAYTTWMELQTAVNCFIDSSKDPSAGPNNPPPPGIRQILERKEGLFRKNMMGKRVDFACRSVISPDPFIGTNEIGLPRYFATVLTFPTPVTDWNAQRMRALVERGADSYPGARWVEMNGRRVDLTKMTRFKREALAANLLSSLKTGTPAVVGRQLTDGDYVLMNRQVRSFFF